MSTKKIEAVKICDHPETYYMPSMGMVAVRNLKARVTGYYVTKRCRNYATECAIVQVDSTNFHTAAAASCAVMLIPADGLSFYFKELSAMFPYYAHPLVLAGMSKALEKMAYLSRT